MSKVSQRRKSKSAPRSTAPSAATKQRNAVFCVLLAAATIALYSPVIGHSFIVWDDRDYVTANPYIHSGLSWNTIKWAFTSTAAANWHPLTWLSHALDYQLFGLNPAGHHLDSCLLYTSSEAEAVDGKGRCTRVGDVDRLTVALHSDGFGRESDRGGQHGETHVWLRPGAGKD